MSPLMRAILLIVLVVGSFVFIYPFAWMIVTAVVSPDGRFVGADNLAKALTTFDFWTYTRNSLITTIIPVVGTVLASSLAGFAFARIGARGAKALFAVVISTMLLPSEVTLIPLFLLFKSFGMINTLYPLIIPNIFGTAFAIFLFRQFYLRFPQSLVDAALIDGAGWLRIWWTIFVPLSRPAFAAVGVMFFIGYWNNFINPLIFVNSDRWKTLPLGLAQFQSSNPAELGVLMAATLITVVPCIVLFFLAQRAFIEGVSFTGQKS